MIAVRAAPGNWNPTSLGVTGSGKTFTMAKVIEQSNRPALILAHNKTLAAQLYHEFKQFFPGNAVEYFVSYYDYYQPEAYIPAGDLYIEKEATINEELDKLRLSATRSLFERRDAIIVSSVSPASTAWARPKPITACCCCSKKARSISRKDITRRLSKSSTNATTATSAAEPSGSAATSSKSSPPTTNPPTASSCSATRSSRLSQIDPLFGTVKQKYSRLPYLSQEPLCGPARAPSRSHRFHRLRAQHLGPRTRAQGRMVEAQRVHQRTRFDLEMIKSMGYCHGIVATERGVRVPMAP